MNNFNVIMGLCLKMVNSSLKSAFIHGDDDDSGDGRI